MKIELAKKVMEREEGLNHLIATVVPAKSEGEKTKPNAILLVLDNSGSMSAGLDGRWGYHHQPVIQRSFNQQHGFVQHNQVEEQHVSKLECVKQASEKLVDMLGEGDKLSLVSFSDIGQEEYPLTSITMDEKFKMKDRIRQLSTRGSTNVSSGLDVAYNQITENKNLKDTHDIKIILLSDGHANYGIREADAMATYVKKFEQVGASISTIGVGNDYNSYYMETIATASGGMFYHLKTMDMLSDILTKELHELAVLTMKNAKVSLRFDEGLHFESNLNDLPSQGGNVFFVGNVISEMKLAFGFSTIEEVEKDALSIHISFEYDNEKGEHHTVEKEIVVGLTDEEDVEVNKEVVKYVQMLTEAQVKKEALRHYETMDTTASATSIQKGMGVLRSMKAGYGINTDEMEQGFTQLQADIRTQSIQANDVKEMYSSTYRVLRNSKEE